MLQVPALHPVHRNGEGQSASVLHEPGVTSSSMHASVHPALPQWVIWQTDTQAGPPHSAPSVVQGGNAVLVVVDDVLVLVDEDDVLLVDVDDVLVVDVLVVEVVDVLGRQPFAHESCA